MIGLPQNMCDPGHGAAVLEYRGETYPVGEGHCQLFALLGGEWKLAG